MPRGKKLTAEDKAAKAQEQADKRAEAARRKEAKKETIEGAKAFIKASRRKYTKKPKAGESEAPAAEETLPSGNTLVSTAEPETPHVNGMNHQLLNIYRPIQDLLTLTQKKYDEDKEKEKKENEFQLDLATQRENRLFNTRSPWTLMKPLKPSPLDDYDKAIETKRANQRLATAPNKWVKVKAY